ncbi:hypothetical protein RN001_005918 [Aquatica leii]|uniref:DUF4806 domain-containing protein n=1 Tax=Aquatica leii TaxID=1421715 RepID=A0AAN7SJA2_9COLE|nr:hypothetical protein RN001_005918 [Aquatica leii]
MNHEEEEGQDFDSDDSILDRNYIPSEDESSGNNSNILVDEMEAEADIPKNDDSNELQREDEGAKRKLTRKRLRDMKRREEPEDDWPMYRASVFKSYESFNQAKPKLKLAEEQTDVSTDTEQIKKKRRIKKKRHYLSTDTDESTGDERYTNPKIKPFSAARSMNNNNFSTASRKLYVNTFEQENSVGEKSSCLNNVAHGNPRVYEEADIGMEVVTNKVSRIPNTLHTTSAGNELIDTNLLNSTSQFMQSQHITKFAILSDFQEKVFRELSTAFWELRVTKNILQSIRRNVNGRAFLEKDIIDSIKNWLRHAKARFENKTNVHLNMLPPPLAPINNQVDMMIDTMFQDGQRMYACWLVVHFVDDDSVEVVPDISFVKDSQCFWPPASYNKKQTYEAIRKRQNPNCNWKLFRNRLLGSYAEPLAHRSNPIASYKSSTTLPHQDSTSKIIQTLNKIENSFDTFCIEQKVSYYKIMCSTGDDASYVGVEFSKDSDGGVALVSNTWLTPRKRNVFWPNHKKNASLYNKALRKHEMPGNEPDWKLFSIERCFFECTNFDEASRKLNAIQFSSDISDCDVNDLSRRRNCRKPLRFEEDESEDESFVSKLKAKRIKRTAEIENNKDTFGTTCLTYNPSSSSISRVNSPSSTASKISDAVSETSISTIVNGSSQANINLEEIASYLGKIYQQNRQILALLSNPTVDTRLARNNDMPDEDILKLMPLKNEEDLKRIEILFSQQSEAVNKLSIYFSYIGAHTTNNYVNVLLKKVISNELACNYNYYGKRGKLPFSTLHLNEMIIQSVRKGLPESKEKEIQNAIKVWLKHSKERSKRDKEN